MDRRQRRSRGGVLKVLAGLVVVYGGLYVYFIHLWAEEPVLFHRTIDRGSASYSGTWKAAFELTAPASKFNFRMHAAKPIDLVLDLHGPPGVHLLGDYGFTAKAHWFSCGKDLPVGEYTFSVQEKGVTGRYTVEIGSPAPVSYWQKLLLLLGALLGLSVIAYAWLRHGRRRSAPTPALAGVEFALGSVLLAIYLLVLSLLAHEGAHALAGITFGAFDFSRSDFFGLGGSPRSGVNPGVHLPDWQVAIRSIAGPVVPTVLGYVLFVGWRSNWGNRARAARTALDLVWSASTGMLLIGQFGMLIPVLRLGTDGDYQGFVGHAPLARWQADGLLVALAVINAVVLGRVIPHLVRLARDLLMERAREAAELRSQAIHRQAPEGGD